VLRLAEPPSLLRKSSLDRLPVFSLILSSHRLSTITNSDQIVVMHKGDIVERGTHNELLALQGRYHAMWEKQTTIEKNEKEQVATQEESS
jgi:ATP-binding cassette, subfamily B, vacuolar membrane transporter HMT1/ACLQ